MELKHLITFQAVASLKSFTRAAEELSYAQSSVSSQVQALETEFGSPLFERLGKSVHLTSAGQRLLVYAEKMIRLADEAKVVVPEGEEPSGRLLVGMPESLCAYRLPKLIHDYNRIYKHVEIVVKSGACSELKRQVAVGALDVTFTLEELYPSETLTIRQLTPEPMCLISGPLHRLAPKTKVSLSDLDGEVFIFTEQGSSYRVGIEEKMASAGIKAGSTMEFFSIEAIKQCVMAGIGIAFLPKICVERELQNGDIRDLNLQTEVGPYFTQMAWHRDKWLSPALRAFIQMTTEFLETTQTVLHG